MKNSNLEETATPDDDLEPAERPPWTATAQGVAAVLWPAFMAAAFATMLFFAFIDPALITPVMDADLTSSRMTGYAIGFFFFWLITLISSAVSVYMIMTARRLRDQSRKQ